jgi:hypothetical protein
MDGLSVPVEHVSEKSEVLEYALRPETRFLSDGIEGNARVWDEVPETPPVHERVHPSRARLYGICVLLARWEVHLIRQDQLWYGIASGH